MMLRKITFLTLTVGLSLVQAGPFRPADVAGDAQWVVHMDVDHFRTTRIADTLFQAIDESPGAERMAEVKRLFQLNPRVDFHAVTLYGPDNDEDHAVVVLKTNYDKAALVALMESADDYDADTYQGLPLHRFTNRNAMRKGRRVTQKVWVCFPDSGTILFCNTVDRLKTAVDVIEKRSPCLAESDSALLPMIPARRAFFAATANMVNLGREHRHAVLLQQTDAMAIAMDETNDQLTASVRVEVRSPEAALQLNQIVSGFMAMANLAAAQQPDNAWMVNLADNLDISVAGKTLTMTLAMPVTEVVDAIKKKVSEKRLEK